MKFCRNERGSVAMFTGLSIAFVSFATVATIDYTKAVKVRSSAQSALDAAVISCASSTRCSDAQFMDVLKRNGGDPANAVVNLDYSPDTGIAKGTANVKVPSMILGGAVSLVSGSSNPFTEVGVRSAAQSPQGGASDGSNLQDHEIVLALDASDSMAGEIRDVKQDTEYFIDQLYSVGAPRMSLIPFGAVVRFPLDHGFEDYLDISSCPEGIDCTISNWNGCFEMETLAEVEALQPARQNSMRFFPDEPHVLRNRERSLCPPVENEAMFFSNNETDLLTKVSNLGLSFGTGSERSLAWAYRALKSDAASPYRQGLEPTSKTRSIILFSDGIPRSIGDATPERGANDEQDLRDTFQAVCDAINADPDVDLYVTYYNDGNPNSRRARNGRQLMSDCARDVSHFWFSDGDNLRRNFDEIKLKISEQAQEAEAATVPVRLIAFPDA